MSGSPFGRYELLRKIAAGGMAEIFLARHWCDGNFFRDVVIKRLFSHMAEDPALLEMFQFEARLLAELSHPNVPQVYELVKGEGTWYMAMEHVDGETLADLWRTGINAGNPMPLPVALSIVQQVADALHHVHERRDRAGRPLRIVHCDVTPQNIVVTRSGIAKLLDFGVAQTAARRDVPTGGMRGTLSYMAPEQVRSKRLDKRADVFALGVILYEITTGTRLFRGTDIQIMTAIAEEDVPPPSVRVQNYPRELEDIVLAALSRSRSARIPSTAHLALGIEQFAMRAGLVTRARTVEKYFAKLFPHENTTESELGLVGEAPSTQLPKLDAKEGRSSDKSRKSDRKVDPKMPLDPEQHSAYIADSEEVTVPPVPDGPPPPAPMSEPPMPEATSPDVRAPRSVRPEATSPNVRAPRSTRPLTEDEVAELIASEDDAITKVPGGPPSEEVSLNKTQVGAGVDSENEPVVLLGTPKRREQREDEGDYVRDLGRRLDEG